jgi:hypothetical protein
MKTKEMKTLRVISRNEKVVSKEQKAVGKASRNTQSKEESTELKAVAKVHDSDSLHHEENTENVDPAAEKSEGDNAASLHHATEKKQAPKVSSAARRKELLEACTGESVEALISLVSSSQV